MEVHGGRYDLAIGYRGLPGTQVTIAGSGFGTTQGTGQVWLGTANGVVQRWSDTQVVAQVATGSATGNAQILQNGVFSNAVPFTINTLQLTNVSPTSGGPGASITISGSGFGAAQGSGVVWLGSTAGQVVTWSDTQIVATVAAAALTGIARVRQNGSWSNAVAFTVPGGNNVTLVPNLLNLVVGDTHTVQAVNSSGQPVTGLTWATSDATVVSLSTDNPPLLCAVAAGHATITAGSASIDVTVSSAASLPLGAVIWSNPGSGSGVLQIVPAVPSPSGVADVFAFQSDGTVQAITSDGVTAWTAQVGCPGLPVSLPAVADFLGGLVAMQRDCNGGGNATSIVRFDGMTGQTDFTYTPPAPWFLGGSFVRGVILVHPDGTIFTVLVNMQTNPVSAMVVGIDPTTGTQKFSAPLSQSSFVTQTISVNNSIVAGDGYAYVPYVNTGGAGGNNMFNGIRVLRVNSSGASDDIPIQEYIGPASELPGSLYPNVLTNADTGTVLTWTAPDFTAQQSMAVTNGTSVSLVSAPVIGGQGFGSIIPVLQAQDGSFVGTAFTADFQNGFNTPNIVAFDGTGNVRWTVPGYTPQIATDDGGVIAADGNTGSAVAFNQNGTATGKMNPAVPSWSGETYFPVIGRTRRPSPGSATVCRVLWTGGSWKPIRERDLRSLSQLYRGCSAVRTRERAILSAWKH